MYSLYKCACCSKVTWDVPHCIAIVRRIVLCAKFFLHKHFVSGSLQAAVSSFSFLQSSMSYVLKEQNLTQSLCLISLSSWGGHYYNGAFLLSLKCVRVAQISEVSECDIYSSTLIRSFVDIFLFLDGSNTSLPHSSTSLNKTGMWMQFSNSVDTPDIKSFLTFTSSCLSIGL